ncbi:hypothetical protein HMPREF9689_05419 [Klebsiella oxytoca 10-5245]|uniref:hypothetical protein n=1 Tax=Klebsiella oxytoca TaxID=571 RepID=UPI00024FE1B2|nr:hypothetical protein [Klebsiella oxytoca]EHS88587.1 hypothetical protein HMPREF9689_05419 [Klebsiella oxytoca 10-5245]
MTTICPQCGSDRISERHIGRKTGGIAGGFDIKNSDIIYGVMEDKFGNSTLMYSSLTIVKFWLKLNMIVNIRIMLIKLMNILSDV